MVDHLRECRILSPETVPPIAARNNQTVTFDTSSNLGTTHFGSDDIPSEYDAKFENIEHNIIALRSALNEEIRQRHQLINSVGEVRKQNVETEKWSAGINQFRDKVEKHIDIERSEREAAVQGCHDEINRIERQYQV